MNFLWILISTMYIDKISGILIHWAIDATVKDRCALLTCW